jgi:hypothetical protein
MPVAIVIDPSEGTDGADDGVRGWSSDVFGAFEDVTENAANFPVTDGDKVESSGVAIEGTNVDFEIVSSGLRAAPVNELFLNEIAPRMLTDGTVRFVPVHIHTFDGSGKRMHGRTSALLNLNLSALLKLSLLLGLLYVDKIVDQVVHFVEADTVALPEFAIVSLYLFRGRILRQLRQDPRKRGRGTVSGKVLWVPNFAFVH